MEIRLRNLQDKMKMQQLEDESIARPGGSRWGSARTDKGSISNYAKDVKEKQLKQSMKSKTKVNLVTGEVIRSTSSSSTNAATIISNDPSKYADTTNGSGNASISDVGEAPGFQMTVPLEWGVDEVAEWLSAMGLPQYCDAFISNEMTGSVLLDLCLEDLDYLGITKLAHRKTLVKAVEELRLCFSAPNMSQSELVAAYADIFQKHGGAGSSPAKALMSRAMGGLPKAPDHNNNSNNSNSNSKNNNNNSNNNRNLRANAPDNYQQHWSHLEPLSANDAPNEPMLPNGADNDDVSEQGVAGYKNEVLDEEAERAAFSEAVMAWRNQGKVTVSSNNTKNAANNNKKQSLASSSLTMTDADPTESGTSAASAAGTGAGDWVNPWDNPASSIDTDDMHSDLFGPEKSQERKHTQIIRPSKRTEKTDSSTVTTTTGVTLAAQSGGMTIVREQMSEEAEKREREEFTKAVMEWRRSGSNTNTNPGTNADAKQSSSAFSQGSAQGMAMASGSGPEATDGFDMVKGSLLDQKQRNLELTERLRRDMDSKYEQNAKELEAKKQNAREQLERVSCIHSACLCVLVLVFSCALQLYLTMFTAAMPMCYCR